MAQQILLEAEGAFKSFFALLKLANKGEIDKKAVKLPRYLPKNAFWTLIIAQVRTEKNNNTELTIPYSRSFTKRHSKISIKMPPILKNRKIKEIRIIPKLNARFFEVQYTYKVEEQQKKLDQTHALAIDLGVNNLVTYATNKGKTGIIDGRKLKSVNQYYNKKVSHLQKIKKSNIMGIE